MVKKSYLFLLICLVALVSLGFVSAAHIVTNSSLGTSFRANEDSPYVYNITINNTDPGQTANITQVNVTFWGNFNFTSNSNGTNAANVLFSNTSSVLSWTNTTNYVINGSELKYFWFNLTANTPGVYNITITTLNATGADSTNLSVTINDITAPYYIDFASPTPAAYSNLSQTSLPVNISVNDSYSNINTIRIYLYNSTGGLVNNTNVSAASSSMNTTGFINFTGLSEGVYYVNATANDSSGNENLTGPTRIITLDTTNPLISFGSAMSASGSYVNRNWIYVNVTSTDTYLKNLTIYLYNSDKSLNRSNTTTTSPNSINYTSLADGIYFFNATAYDYSRNSNSTVTGNLTVDTINPLITNGTGTDNNGTTTAVNRSWIYFNASLSESNPSNITFYLYNTTSQVNATTYSLSSTASNNTVNWTRLINGNYTYYATIFDKAGNYNSSINRTIRILDNTAPTITLESPADASSSATTSYNFTFNVSDDSDIASCSLILDGSIINTLTSLSKASENGMYNSSSVGSHNWTINCTDVTGNVGNSSTRTLIITSPPETGGTNGGGGGPSTTVTTYNITDSELTLGYTKELATTARIKFAFNGAAHTVTMRSTSRSQITVLVSSTPQEKTILLGSSAQFDINSDNVNDILVKYVSFANNKATITVSKISATPATPKTPTTQPAQTESQQPAPTPSTEPTVKKSTNYVGPIIILIIIILICFIIYTIVRSHHKVKHVHSHVHYHPRNPYHEQVY
jgi:hypothetical protein